MLQAFNCCPKLFSSAFPQLPKEKEREWKKQVSTKGLDGFYPKEEIFLLRGQQCYAGGQQGPQWPATLKQGGETTLTRVLAATQQCQGRHLFKPNHRIRMKQGLKAAATLSSG